MAPSDERFHDDRVNRIANADELDSALCESLGAMLASPTNLEVDQAVANLRGRGPAQPKSTRPETTNSKRSSTPAYRMLLAVAASGVFLALWLASLTDAWADVTQDFQAPTNEPQQMSTLDPAANEPLDVMQLVGAPLRFVLIVHIASLLIGLIGMSLAWLLAMFDWVRKCWATSSKSQWPEQIGNRILLSSLVVYGIGLFFGCIWSNAAWGRVWSWDPREAFSLITIGLGIVWYSNSIRSRDNVNSTPLKRATLSATIACIAFGLVLLMQSLGGIYSAELNTYGFPSTVPSSITVGIGLALLAVWSGYFAATRFQSGAKQPQ